MHLGENSSLPPENIIRQTCFAKQTFIQNKSLLCRRTATINNTVAMCFFHLRARVEVVGVLVMVRAPSRAHVSFSCDSWLCVCLCISSQLVSVSSTQMNILAPHLFLPGLYLIS